jgi:rhomboid-related protein 1/2/3
MFLYLAGVYLGAIACAVSDVYSMVVGASGGVFALVGLHVANLLINWSELRHSKVNRSGTLLFVAIICGIEVFEIVVSSRAKTSHSAHVGGFTGGLLLGIMFLWNPVVTRFEKYIMLPAAIIGAVTFAGFGSYWVFSHFPPKEIFGHSFPSQYSNPPCCWQVSDCAGLDVDYYGNFVCSSWLERVESESRSEVISSHLIAHDNMISSCSEMKSVSWIGRNRTTV